MNARERVLAVLNDETPDTTPVDLWLVPELIQSLKSEFHVQTELDVYRRLGVDKIVWLGVPYVGKAPPTPPGSTGVNMWGIGFSAIQANTAAEYNEVSHRPLAGYEDPRELADYPWPSPDNFDYDAAVATARERSAEFVTLGPWVSLFEVYCGMRSLEEALIDTVANPEFVHAALDRIASIQGEMMHRFLKAAKGAVDMVFVSDDMGTQQSLLISPESFDEFLFPRLKKWTELIHDHGARVFFHTDGAAGALIPRLLDAGIDILNPIQHVCPGMERRSLKRDYGDRLIFHGGVENQRVLPFGTPAEVADETQSCLEQLGPDRYIPCSCHYAQADTPRENLTAMIETVKAFRA